MMIQRGFSDREPDSVPRKAGMTIVEFLEARLAHSDHVDFDQAWA